MRTGENIYKRKDGRWEARYKCGYTNSGKPKYKSIYAKTYTLAKEKRDQAIRLNTNIISMPQRMITFDKLFLSYINYIRASAKLSSIGTYTEWHNKHLSPFFGRYKIIAITPEMVNAFIKLKLTQISETHTFNLMILFMSLMNYAESCGIPHQNYYKKIIKLNPPTPNIEIFTADELMAIEQYLLENQNRIHIAILLCFSTGLRLGELCALSSEDIDEKRGIVKVTKTMQRIKNINVSESTKTKIVITSPKTKSGIREVPIPHYILSLLLPFLRKNSFLLTGSLQAYIEPRTLENKWKQILSNVGIPYRKFHTIRHTFATNAIRYGIYDIRTLAEILGHNSIDVTFQKYVHSDITTKIQQAQTFNTFFLNRHFFGSETLNNPTAKGFMYCLSPNAIFYENKRAS